MLDRYYVLDAKKLELLLIQKGWSLADLAANAGMSERRLQTIMKGGRQVYRSNLKLIADQFGVKPEELRESGPHSVNNANTPRSPMVFEAEGLPDDFEPTSIMVGMLVGWLANKVGGNPLVVDCDQNKGSVKLTIEINSSNFKELFDLLYRGLKDEVQIMAPGEIPMGAGTPCLYFLWFTKAIRFPDDCPNEYLRGRAVTPENRFKLLMPSQL